MIWVALLLALSAGFILGALWRSAIAEREASEAQAEAVEIARSWRQHGYEQGQHDARDERSPD